MAGGLKKHLDEFINRRVEELSHLKLKNNEEYIKLSDTAFSLQQKLMPLLTDEQKNMFIKYEEAMSGQEVIMRDGLYKDGLFDGIKLAKFIQKF